MASDLKTFRQLLVQYVDEGHGFDLPGHSERQWTYVKRY